MFLLVALLLLFQDSSVPYKAKDEFDVTVDLQFKRRNYSSRGSDAKIEFTETWGEREKKKTGELLPYLKLNLVMKKLSEKEVKIRIINAFGVTVYAKKAKLGKPIELEMGFVEDIKDRISSPGFNVILLSSDKKEISRVDMYIEKDGTYWVNKVQYGKF